ncbi:MAG: D-3-phosphoglycerate dehydrogenase [Planctomycetes bacterium TMED75]|nr:phosphoglycerate dehydrogenase [Planctomycetaceae bacterium]OUU92224.1 MAG: D-3-phosphoglycerate dehydrogenase [Planctomycetes bacterium TMED75]
MSNDTGSIVLLEGIHPAAEEMLAKTGLPLKRIEGAVDHDRLPEVLEGASILGIRSRTQLDETIIQRAENLVAIGCFCIGTNQVDLEAAARRGVAVFNAPFSNTRSVAELTIAEIIMLMRRIPQRSSDMHVGRWQKSVVGSREVRGRTLGIVGYGHIGSQLSILAEGLGMRVVYHDIIEKLPLGNAIARDDLHALLSESDVVSLHVPATAMTAGMMGAAELEAMKDGAFLVNNARGNVVDIDALAKAVESGKLGGAAVDVFPEEPRSGTSEFQSPLRGLENVLLTPHIGGSTREAQSAIAREVGTKLARYLKEGATGTAVNLPAVDLPPRQENQQRILHFHHNVPGVLSRMHTALAGLGVNINAEYLQSQGELSYVILDVDPIDPETIHQELKRIPETIRFRTISD